MNISDSTPFWQTYAIQNEFHSQPNARDVTLNSKPWQKEVGHCLDPDEPTVHLR